MNEERAIRLPTTICTLPQIVLPFCDPFSLLAAELAGKTMRPELLSESALSGPRAMRPEY
eukprot:scaffold12794_cov125-Isochrysis_galbana.AAC.2